MEKVMVRLPHGYFNGGVTKLPTVSPTIDAHIDCWHILIGEQMEVYYITIGTSEGWTKKPQKDIARTLLTKESCGGGY